MSYNATPTDGSTPAIPMSSVIVAGDKTPKPLQGGTPTTDSNGNTIAPVMAQLSPGTAVIGQVTANAGANLNTSALAVETGGNLATIAANTGHIPANGQSTMSASVPVVIASDQSAVPVSGTFWQATQPVSGSVTANAGTNLNTSALAVESGGNLASANTHLASIDTHTPALGQAVKASSVPVTLASDQGAVSTTDTNSSAMNSSLSSIATNTGNSATNTSTVAGAVSGGKMQANVSQIGGQAPTLDNTSIQAVSMRGKGAGTAGDTPLLLDTSGHVLNVAQKAAWTSVYSTTQTGVSTWAGSGDISVGSYDSLLININISAITGTSIQFKVSRKDSFGNYVTILTASAIASAAGQSISIGPGTGGSGSGSQSSHFLGSTIQITATFTSVTSVSFTIDAEAR